LISGKMSMASKVRLLHQGTRQESRAHKDIKSVTQHTYFIVWQA
jgi:hypothetical protein